jgi:beta-galactosidase
MLVKTLKFPKITRQKCDTHMKSIILGFRPSLCLNVAAAAACLYLTQPRAWSANTEDSPRQRLLMDLGWKFRLGDQWGTGERLDKAGASGGPAGVKFSDRGWRDVNLPHDWAVELPFDPKADEAHGFKPVGPGYGDTSVGWYRRSFPLAEADKSRRLWLEFDGAFRDCRVFLNGYLIGHHESGYSGFRYDITDAANYGGNNVLAVRVDASEFEGWFYEGAGIYRHVWLVKTSPLAVAPDGTFVYSEFPNNVPQGPAAIHVETRLLNASDNSADAAVQCQILDPDGKPVAQFEQTAAVNASDFKTVLQVSSVPSPVLWSPETPRLYKLVTTVALGGRVVDRTETEFGIRTLAFDADKGFLLNGRPYFVKGTCNHQDHAGVGIAMPDALQYFRVARLKEMGCNGIRTAHGAPTPELLEACDHLGMLVLDENRLLGSDAANLGRLEDMIRRDRNHPSVFIWSLFNEEWRQSKPDGGRAAKTMQSRVHRLDPTRKCTCAASNGDRYDGVNSVMDVRGWNYSLELVDSYHQAHPAQPNIGTEPNGNPGTRGIYANDLGRGYMNAYEDEYRGWNITAEAAWKIFAARPWLSGQFVWTGFDYRGEPSVQDWPCNIAPFGIVDLCGFPKDVFFYYQSWWSDRTVLHLFPHWNWAGKEGQDIYVRCYSNCEEVELFLNGESLGRKRMSKNSDLRWKVKYAPGALVAKGYKNGQAVAEDKAETAGPPAAVRLAGDRASIHADGEDLGIVTVGIVDAQGRLVPTAGNLVTFDLSGPGAILGVGNGDPSCHEADVCMAGAPMSQHAALNDWRFKRTDNTDNRPEVQESFDDNGWDKVEVTSPSGPLKPDESAVFRTHFEGVANMLDARSIVLGFGMIDDEGWVYVNGRLVGESHDYTDQPSFEIRPFIHAGANSIAVAVKNNGGPGGVNNGVTLSIVEKPASKLPWQRSVFSGLAQIIVQAGRESGKIHLTAHSEGLSDAALDIPAEPATPRPSVPQP